MSSEMRILLADDHVLVRAGFRALLQKIPGAEVVAEAGDGIEAIDLLSHFSPNLALFDISMPGLNGIEATVRALEKAPELKVIMVSMHVEAEHVRRALKCGARGFLIKGAQPSELRVALETVMQGDIYLSPDVSKHVLSAYVRGDDSEAETLMRLSPRHREVLQLLAEGNRTKEIANKLHISSRTVEAHRAKLMDALNIHDLPGLVKFAIRMRLITPTE